MHNLYQYDVLVNEVFYRCWHILEYCENHSDMTELEREAIKATIMDALVFRQLIDPSKQSLDLENFCIVDNLEHYVYQKHPNISGIPLWMKEEFRKKSLTITGGTPISIFLAKPPSKGTRFCVYDPNTAVSSIFPDATFYNAIYVSPTRGIRISEKRPFVEVDIDGELYLVDTLTKRILKSSWFRENYDFKVIDEMTVSKMDKGRLACYQEQISSCSYLATMVPLINSILENLSAPAFAEWKYEYEQSKKYFPEEWEKAEIYQKEMDDFFNVKKYV